ncbi:UNVERIFIED_CONTAM: putative F-box protein [Sesamum radiatum]|uniref:F-box protein n=1 Tax=Sesamum radiatum TaxID=300843 RepID=A0AAW2PXA1_SESRA
MDKHQLLLMNLPTHIMLEILARLPPKTIFICKRVCKTWLELINDPHFATFYFSRCRAGLVVHHSEMFKKYFKLVDFVDAYDHHDLPHDTMLKFTVNKLSSFFDANIVVDGSANGFLFMRDINYKHETLYICNPLTREYIELPKPQRVARYPSVVTHGFGVASKSGEYKVVRIFHERELNPRTRACRRVPSSECQVYTLGTGAWRTVGEAPFSYNSRLLGLSSGEIFTEYGVEKSWTKEIVIRKIPELAGPSFEVVQALKIFTDGTILLLWGDFFMLYYCSKTGTAKEVDLEQPSGPNSIEAIHYVPSFLSLKRFPLENVSPF